MEVLLSMGFDVIPNSTIFGGDRLRVLLTCGNLMNIMSFILLGYKTFL